MQQNPDASPYDLVSLKAFVREIVYGIDGAEGIEEACEETVRKYWNNFTAAWRRGDPEKPRDIARSVTHVCLFVRSDLFGCCELNLMQFIKGPLAEEVRLTKSKRSRRFATKTHLLHFARQL